MMQRKAAKYHHTIQAGDLTLPVDITVERRNGIRYGITGKRITLRVPYGVSKEELWQHITELQTWVEKTFAAKPKLRELFVPVDWKTGDTLTVGTRTYTLWMNTALQATSTASIQGNSITLTLNTELTGIQRSKTIKTLLSRIVARDFHSEITRRVLDWNERTVRRTIKSVNLKYNHSNWGSCSSQNNINLSTRLLFAPEPVQDYVILHELAHLVEHNHSHRFWALVEKYMPDYAQHELWLKNNRELCDFK
jgi:predicted metal-dependent hydrolase